MYEVQDDLQVLSARQIGDDLVGPGPVEDPGSGVDAVPREPISQRTRTGSLYSSKIFLPLLAMTRQFVFVEGDPASPDRGPNGSVFEPDREDETV